jgi:threonine dehydratase
MPSTAKQVKVNAVAGYGANITRCEPTLVAREATASAKVAETGATLVPPYDDFHVVAGQATAVIELLEEAEKKGIVLDAVICPVGGGGLMSGTCLAASAMQPGIRLIGGEPMGADDAARSLACGSLIPQTGPNTICDGLLTSVGRLPWAVISRHLESIITVSEDEVKTAMKLLWERNKTVVEPSSSVALAAVMSKACPLPPGSKVGLILSGGNVDLNNLPF